MVGTVYTCPADGSKSLVQAFRAVGNSNLSTANYCSVELAPTATELTVVWRAKISGKVIFHNTRHEHWLEHYQGCVESSRVFRVEY